MDEDALFRLPMFENLPSSAVEAIQRHSHLHSYADGTVLCLEGQPVESIFILLEGTVEIIKALGSTEENRLALRHAGDTLGEMSLYAPQQVRSASVRASGNVRAIQIARDQMESLVHEYPQIALWFVREISQRMRDSENHLIQDLRLRNQSLQEALIELKAAQSQLVEQEKLEHELAMARHIQQSMLPKQIPSIPGWQLHALWEPARAVSGDFYDFIPFQDGCLGVIIGDVTGKGVPAALVMATSRSVLRAVTGTVSDGHHSSPGEILSRVNTILGPDMPPMMFVTCLMAIIDLENGTFTFANAGHVLPFRITNNGVVQLRATGLPLGLFPDLNYDSASAKVEPGESLFFLSDGLVEAHNPQGEMFGSTRLKEELLRHAPNPSTDGKVLFDHLMRVLRGFTGEGWEQEDDLTFVILKRM